MATMATLSPKPSKASTEAEVIHRRGPWRNFGAVEFVLLERVDWFNNGRFLEPIGNLPPAEAAQRHYAMLDQPAVAAHRRSNGLPKPEAVQPGSEARSTGESV